MWHALVGSFNDGILFWICVINRHSHTTIHTISQEEIEKKSP